MIETEKYIDFDAILEDWERYQTFFSKITTYLGIRWEDIRYVDSFGNPLDADIETAINQVILRQTEVDRLRTGIWTAKDLPYETKIYFINLLDLVCRLFQLEDKKGRYNDRHNTAIKIVETLLHMYDIPVTINAIWDDEAWKYLAPPEEPPDEIFK